MKYIYSILILTILFSCQTDSKKQSVSPSKEHQYDTVFIKRFGFQSRLEGIDTAFLKITESADSKSYIYNVSDHGDSLLNYYAFKMLRKKDTLCFDEEKCPLIDSKTYSIDQKDYNVRSYYYDVENSADEESTIYITDQYGVLIIFNDGWLVMAGIFEYDEMSRKLVKMILSDSTNSFPLWRKDGNYPSNLEVPGDIAGANIRL